MHVQIHVDRPAVGEALPHRGLSVGIMAPRRHPAVDLLHLIDDGVPVANKALRALDELGPQARRGDQPLELACEGQGVTGLKQQATLPLADQLLVQRQVRGHGDRARCERLPQQPRGHLGAT